MTRPRCGTDPRAQLADRSAVLREAADQAETVALRLRMKHDVGAANGAYEVMEELRRMADETPAAPAQSSDAAETPEDAARRLARRLFAVEQLCSGRPGYHTLTVKQVLTAISDADDEPATGARQDETDHVCNSVQARGEMDEPLGYLICGVCGKPKSRARQDGAQP